MSKKPASGETVTKTKLTRFYDRYATTVLRNKLTALDRKRKERQKYRVHSALPDKDEYVELRDEQFTSTVADVVDEAFAEAEALGEEIREWYDNLPESFQDSDKGYSLDEAANGFENLDRPDTPGANDGDSIDVRSVSVLYLPDLEGYSRPRRAAECSGKLRAVVDLFRDADHEDEDDRQLLGDVWEENGDLKTEINEWLDELENQADEIEAIEIPGMYG